MKTCSLTSLFILVVLRWIEGGSRLDDEGIWKSCQSSHYSITFQEELQKAWWTILKFTILFHSQIDGQTKTDYPDLKRLEIIYFEWTDIEANLHVWMSWLCEGWSYWRRIFTPVDSLKFRYLVIRSFNDLSSLGASQFRVHSSYVWWWCCFRSFDELWKIWCFWTTHLTSTRHSGNSLLLRVVLSSSWLWRLILLTSGTVEVLGGLR